MGRIEAPLSGHPAHQLRGAIGVVGGGQRALAAEPQAAHRLDPIDTHLGLEPLPQGRRPRRPAGGGITAAPAQRGRHSHGSAP